MSIQRECIFLMFQKRCIYTISTKRLNPKLGYVGNKSPFVLDVVWDIYALAIHNIKLSKDKETNKLLTYSVPEFNVIDKVLVQNDTRRFMRFEIWSCLKSGMSYGEENFN